MEKTKKNEFRNGQKVLVDVSNEAYYHSRNIKAIPATFVGYDFDKWNERIAVVITENGTEIREIGSLRSEVK
jgi:hypothetical protein